MFGLDKSPGSWPGSPPSSVVRPLRQADTEQHPPRAYDGLATA